MPFQLDRSDLISFEAILKNSLAEVFDFSSYSLYFPREIPRQMQSEDKTVPVIEKDRVLLPLTIKDRFLGVFLARGTNQNTMQTLENQLPVITSLILDKIILHKKCMVDSRTGLYNQDHFQQIIEKEIEAVLSSISPDGPGVIMDNGQEHHSASFGIMLLNLDNFKWINNTYGYSFGDRILSSLAAGIKSSLPEQVPMARLERDTFAFLHPHISPGKSLDFLDSLRRTVEETVFEYDVSGEKVTLTASGGASFFPHDMKGPQFRNNPDEIARIVQNKAEQAMHMAKRNGGNRVYSFSRLLSQGGVILETLPLGRLVINLGKNVDASEGQKFMVWSSKYNGSSEVQGSSDQPALGHYPPIHKGEIAILEVQDRISIAEVLYLNDPSWRMEQGDRLSLLNDKDSILEKEGLAQDGSPKKDILTGLYSYRDFLSLWNQNRSRPDCFCMAMIKIRNYPSGSEQSIESENLIQLVVKFLHAETGSHILGGRYSSTCLVFYLPEAAPDKLTRVLEKLQDSIKQQHGIILNAGMGCYPYLNFSRIDTLDNARKALEHAGMISFPHVACFDSLTLTVSADRLFTQGDLFRAMEEYELALADDDTNILARNSLAICYARLGRLELARKHFHTITRQDPANLMAWYNFGCVCLKQGDVQEAREAFLKCLDIDPGHCFSLFRLGQIAEQADMPDKAEEFYNRAKNTSEGKDLAPRHLARLSWKKGNMEEAREQVHQALVSNPRDAFSLNLMSRIYLESGDDPQIAESLARQSVVLRPDVSSFWLDLADILQAQGKDAQADRARIRAYA